MALQQRAEVELQLRQLQQDLADVDERLAQLPGYVVGRPPRWVAAAHARRELILARIRMREGELADLDMVEATMAARQASLEAAELERRLRRAGAVENAVQNPVDDAHPAAS